MKKCLLKKWGKELKCLGTADLHSRYTFTKFDTIVTHLLACYFDTDTRFNLSCLISYGSHHENLYRNLVIR